MGSTEGVSQAHKACTKLRRASNGKVAWPDMAVRLAHCLAQSTRRSSSPSHCPSWYDSKMPSMASRRWLAKSEGTA